jgi:membrane dipeptidase
MATKWLCLLLSVPGTYAEEAIPSQALQLHESAIVLDSHLDTPANFSRPRWSILDNHQGDRDFSQVGLKAGGLDGGFWALYTEQGASDVAGNKQARDQGLLRMTDIQRMLAAHPGTFELATRQAKPNVLPLPASAWSSSAWKMPRRWPAIQA